MNESGIWLIGLALLALGLFPLCVYVFFHLVVLRWKSKSLVDDLTSRRAFKNNLISDQWKGPDHIHSEMQKLYGYKRFAWPLTWLVAFYLICFSIVWDLVRYRFGFTTGTPPLFYTQSFLCAAELPLMAFLGVVIFNCGHLVRRLYAWDVTTHVYWNALQRTWLVLGVAVVLAASMSLASSANGSEGTGWVHGHAAFFTLGFLVNPVVQGLLERAQVYFKIKRARVDELPLSLIQGISFWHEYRLEEEGIENVQNLATCDLIDLALTTRYNLRTLLDWVDQAVLIHRMGQKAVTLRTEGFISGAIDMAWSSPENSDDDDAMATQVAKTVGVQTIYVAALMNSLYQDTQVLMLWDLWQSEEDSRDKDGR